MKPFAFTTTPAIVKEREKANLPSHLHLSRHPAFHFSRRPSQLVHPRVAQCPILLLFLNLTSSLLQRLERLWSGSSSTCNMLRMACDASEASSRFKKS